MSKEDVWFIPDPPEKSPSISRNKKEKSPAESPKRPKRSPAVAFSLSLAIWGAGQIYNGQKKLGFLFLLLMINFYTVLWAISFHWSIIGSFLAKFQITSFDLLVVCGAFYLCGLLFWLIGALQAYHRSAGWKPRPKEDEKPSLWPLFCSLIMPGWGQILNGQRKKGIFFLFLAVPGLLALPVSLAASSLWPVLKKAPEHLLLEKVFIAAILTLPFSFLIWIIGIYDAGRIAFDPDKKEPLLDRISYALNRLRMKGWGRGVVPHLKIAMMLILLLAFSLTYSYYYFPKHFYAGRLESLRQALSDDGMVLIPRLIDRSLQIVSSEKKQ